MTENHLAGLWTLTAMIAFIGICLWAYSAKRRNDFDEAANLPFADEDEDAVLENDIDIFLDENFDDELDQCLYKDAEQDADQGGHQCECKCKKES